MCKETCQARKTYAVEDVMLPIDIINRKFAVRVTQQARHVKAKSRSVKKG